MERFIEPIVVGVICGILTTIICFAAVRYWSNRSIKRLTRRIQESEAEKIKLDNLAKSDRALIILGFQGVFAMIAILCMILALQTSFL
jgi:H+/gluconate symporter-like permease